MASFSRFCPAGSLYGHRKGLNTRKTLLWILGQRFEHDLLQGRRDGRNLLA